ncbi:MAG TPA: alpha/beta fold hydrolase [Ktedonobacteraceae bacterium]|nr:alpha/beta fold hydrolase [Ktedonobacteraceae bacterium]
MKQRIFPFFAQKRRFLITALMILVALWAAIPAVRALILVANPSGRSIPHTSSTDLPVQEVHFTASDGVRLAGWLAIASPSSPTIILVHGFKGSRVDMLPWAQFLYHASGYNVLLYDSRGCGESEGWGIALGAREPDDVIGAVQYLKHRSDLTNKHFGALGISLGAGIVLLAAAREPALQATVADSAWVDESAQTHRMGHLSALPLLPYEPILVDALIGMHLEDARPLDVIRHISPHAVMLIHSADDANTTTPLTGEHQLYQAAQSPKVQWIAPSGGHTGALKAHTAEYEQRVLAFFSAYINEH